MKVLVCGGRDYDDYIRAWSVLYSICDEFGLWDEDMLLPEGITIVHGGARGADRLADQWAVANWVPIEEYKADWDKYGKSAGHRRNQEMLDKAKPDLVIAFPGGRGTADMVRRAKEAGVEVREIT